MSEASRRACLLESEEDGTLAANLCVRPSEAVSRLCLYAHRQEGTDFASEFPWPRRRLSREPAAVRRASYRESHLQTP